MKPADVSSLRMLRRARDRIDRDYAEPIPIPALAAGAGYSREHFIRAFRSAYGETPGRYRTRRRVERACELLRSANLTVTEICFLVGFTSLGTFSARFTELVGMSPTAYRREAARRGGPAPIPGCFALMWRAGLRDAGLADTGLADTGLADTGLADTGLAEAAGPASGPSPAERITS
jgi:AraC-like DNA-binding protein